MSERAVAACDHICNLAGTLCSKGEPVCEVCEDYVIEDGEE